MNKLLLLLLLLPAVCRSQYITTVAGTGVAGYDISSGIAVGSTIYNPNGVAVDGAGNIYFSDEAANKVYKVNTAGAITCIAGNGLGGSAGDGGAATAAELYAPNGICLDAGGNVYIADFWNNRIRKVTPAGIISTVAGCCGLGYSGYTGDGGPATLAQLDNPIGVAVDAAGNIYIADQSNNCIRKVNTAGIISTFAGTGSSGGSLGDGGPATAAQIYSPNDIEVDAAGNVYITDEGHYRVRKVDPAGIITSIAGTVMGYTGDGGPATAARLDNPHGITLDGSGNIYFTEEGNNRVRKIDPAGTISTVAGSGPIGWGTGSYNGDGISATAARLSLPFGITADGSGNLYIGDMFNHRLRKVNMSAAPCSGIPPAPTPLGTVTTACDTVRSLLYLPAAPVLTGLQYQWRSSTDSAAWSDIPGATNITFLDTTATTLFYRCILTCTATSAADTTAGVKLTVRTPPDAGTITAIVDTVCPGLTLTLTGSIPGGTWSTTNTNATVVAGTVTGVTPGPVTIRYIVSNSCGPDTATFNVTVSSAGSCTGNVADVFGRQLNIFPNPSTGILSISAPYPLGRITICDLLGTSVYNSFYPEKNITIDISHLPPGIYITSVNGHMRKIVKNP